MQPNIDLSKFIYPQPAGDPKPQPYYSFDSNSWEPKNPASSSQSSTDIGSSTTSQFTSIRLLSWVRLVIEVIEQFS